MTRDAGEKVCAHCLSREPLEPWSALVVDGEEKWFCCHGCRTAFGILREAGLGDFYERRAWGAETGLPEGAYASRYTDAELARYARRVGDEAELLLLVEGIRCASCVWVLERLLQREAGVVSARIGFTSRMARVRFRPEIIGPARVLDVVSRIGYPARPYEVDASERLAARERRTLLIRFGTALFLSMQLMGSSIGLYGGYLRGMETPAREALGWFSFAMATPVVFYCGWPFLSGAWRALRNRAPDMDLLVGLGVGFAYGYSVYALLTGGEVYFDSAATIIAFLLLGRLVEAGARKESLSGIARLLKLSPDRAFLIEGEEAVEVDSSALRPGDVILVKPGGRFPADGVLREGSTEADESAVTGEPYPVPKARGDAVTSGTVNLGAAVRVTVVAAGADAFLHRVATLIGEAQARKPSLERLADRVAAVFVPVVVALAAGAAGFALATGHTGAEALLRAVSVLVVACPCALGLATPLAVMAAAGRAASRGILFKGGDVMERLATVTVAALDKTGTLTLGRPRVSAIETPAGIAAEVPLELAARAEAGSLHPIARGILEEARARGIAAPPAVSQAHPGRGVALATDQGVLRVGSEAFLREAGIACEGLPPSRDTGIEAHVALDGRCLGRIRLEDALRPEAAAALRELACQGVVPVMLTGDRAEAAARVAADLGIGEVRAKLTPDAKAAWVEEAESKGRRVLMVGDGINDAAALAGATVGCSMGGAADVALDSSDLVLLKPDLLRLAEAVRLSRRTLRIIRQNLAWAFGYNALALALAFGGFLVPLYAAAMMALSSICVVVNSLRLIREAPQSCGNR